MFLVFMVDCFGECFDVVVGDGAKGFAWRVTGEDLEKIEECACGGETEGSDLFEGESRGECECKTSGYDVFIAIRQVDLIF